MPEFKDKDPRKTDQVVKGEIHSDELTYVSEDDIKLLQAEQDTLGGDSVDMGRRHFEENLPLAVQSIVKIARHSENDKLRFDASKYIVERVLGKVQDNSSTDKAAWEKLLDDTEHVVPGVTK